MRFTDLIYLAFSALRQQKLRTFLTLFGVVIGTFVLLLSLSIGQGVRETIVREFHRNDMLRTIHVTPSWKVATDKIPADELAFKGEMSEERRERLRQAVILRHRPDRAPGSLLNPEQLRALAQLDGVESVVPAISWSARVRFQGTRRYATTQSVSTEEERLYRQCLVAGSFLAPDRPRGIVVNEYLLYLLGIEDEANVERAVGCEIELEYSSRQGSHWRVLSMLGAFPSKLEPDEEDVLSQIAQRLPSALDRLDLTAAERATLRKVAEKSRPPRERLSYDIRETFTLIGVVRDSSKEERQGPFGMWSRFGLTDIIVPAETLQEMYFRVPELRQRGIGLATVLVDDEQNVEAVEERIRAMGLETSSFLPVLKNLRLNVLLITFATSFVAVVALVVAGLGITNTLLMSVLERTHEIGVMKAVGARERHIQLLFLLEGAWIGLLGSALGVLCGWLASLPGDRIARRLAEQQAETRLTHSLFVFPWWLVLGVLAFVTLLTMLAALYPARRAARVNPMTALRHE